MSEQEGQPAQSSFERAEELLKRLEARSRPLLARGVARAVETAEDIWAEAQELRRRRKEPRS